MLNRIIEFSIRNKLIVWLFIIALISWGGYSVTRLPIDAVPDITNNQVQVLTIAPSQAALDIERQVTFPVEQAMTTIAGMVEIRSFSRFGLSVVTIVFEDDIDVYWARQQVAERLTEAKKQIPPGVGTPELAPITTGLGEIYQYIVKAKPGYEDRYSIADLRTIQDWIIRRQLLGTKGVADVSSFGGYLKQYEVALSTERLRSLDLSIQEVTTALERNNQNTGGAYLEQNSNAYFIRSEGLITSIEDLQNVVIRVSQTGTPLLLKDVGEVKIGHAIRYGAMTQNGKGETVGAVVMMLKGANSSEVIANVTQRIDQIKKTLPEGVTIDPFLDRTKLVNNAIETVTKNLAEGALIVVFVLILMLGNWRAGFVVASVIPLAMLFAIILMNAFGVSGNLMSLGALDFGLIVDGAVIIVEATLHHIATQGFNHRLTQSEMDNEVSSSAKKMMNAAAFGQVIILMVYLPILSLVGIEGKMFKPMAQTVMFAIIGAFVLSLTYVPVASALFLSRSPVHKRNFSDRFIERIQRVYEPALLWAIRWKKTVVAVSVALFAASVLLFNTLGGEFLPELDEGDFAVETRLLTGSSLTSTIDATLRGEQVLLKNFPEVEKVIGKIGSGEIPTDPMPIEAADLMVVMKNKSEWKTAKTKDEMIGLMQAKLQEEVPGVWFGFQHPIQMRFNELMTGARQDVVVKIYGERLGELVKYAHQMSKLVSSIDGTEGIFVENITGLPQIVIRVRRERLAQFNVNIEELNGVINASLGGRSAGLLFEGERRFDIVVKIDASSRQSVEDIRNLHVMSGTGALVPISQIADIAIEAGPNQIQRDDAKRRIVVGFNTRGRDVESIVQELQRAVEKKIAFAPGYYVTYGGSFQNLQEASQRLSIAVPVALALIFLLLYFAFGSIKQGLLIFSAIPLSAVGGIFALWLRDMPFSISAGVGFIALFGVAVLNGIVLIAEFNRLKHAGQAAIFDRVIEGTNTRLRPVLMTAMVASLGFLPMALSHGSGAEVQKPLATVVIGGLISSTLLTLIVLPVLYMLTDAFHFGKRSKTVTVVLLLMCALTMTGYSAPQSTSPMSPMQDTIKSIDLRQAIDLVVRKHPRAVAGDLETSSWEAARMTSYEIPKTDITLMKGQYNSVQKADNNITITQTLPFPTVFAAQRQLTEAHLASARTSQILTQNQLATDVKQTVNLLLFLQASHRLLLEQDSTMSGILRIATAYYQTGEGTKLSQTAAQMQLLDIRNTAKQYEQSIITALERLRSLTQQYSLQSVRGELETLLPEPTLGNDVSGSPSVLLSIHRQTIAEKQKKLEGARVLPDILVGYFNQTLIGTQNVNGTEQYFGASKRFQGFQVGVAIPLWISPQLSRVRSTRYRALSAAREREAVSLETTQRIRSAESEFIKNKNSLEVYRSGTLRMADEVAATSTKAYRAGEIDYNTLLLNISQALRIRQNYLAALYQYNESIIAIELITGKN